MSLILSSFAWNQRKCNFRSSRVTTPGGPPPAPRAHWPPEAPPARALSPQLVLCAARLALDWRRLALDPQTKSVTTLGSRLRKCCRL
eukprot:7083205-Pyramimonas_sp.AAC.1